MKKIVALVLSLVMVLGLATTAFAAPTTTGKDLGDYFFESTGTGTVDSVTSGLFEFKAASPKDVAVAGVKDGLITAGEQGNVKYFMLSSDGTNVDASTGKFVQVAAVTEADYTVYYANPTTGEATDSVFMYLAKLDSNPVYAGTATLFNNFGEDCGQYDFDPDEDTKYYFFQGSIYEVVPAGNDAVSLMIDGKLTSVNEVADLGDVVAHVAKYTYDKNYKIVAVECAECGVAATIYPNYDSVPKADKKVGNVFGPINTDDYYCWNAAKAPAADDDKVESAQTFDAGIAMYVGMSVMAAAGSAVVLKKKD